MKLVWCTDPHLNFLRPDSGTKLGLYESFSKYDGIILSGDIGESHNFLDILNEIHGYTKKPIFFVLGNHDFYGGSVEGVRDMIKKINEPEIHYLTSEKGIQIGDTAIVGVDGFADGGYGDIATSTIRLNDSVHIQELYEQFEAGHLKYPDKHFSTTHPEQRKVISKRQKYLKKEMQRLAKVDTKLLEGQIKHRLKKNPETLHFVVVTHIPPFEQAAVYEGRLTSPEFLPFYTNKSLGGLLLKYALAYPWITFEVLCGHTHNQAIYEPLGNLKVRVGGSEYYYPRISGEIEI